VPDLKLNERQDERERLTRTGPGKSDLPGRLNRNKASVRAAARQAAAVVTPAAIWRNHRLFAILAVASLVPRVLATLAFRPALLTSDSFLYMQEASSRTLGQIRPSGYSFFLGLLQNLPHTLLAVTTAQHLMGIAIAAIVYGLLRYWGLPGWGASLAALPTLFDPRQIALESYILPDTLFALALMLAVALLLTKRTPRLWQCALASLLLAYVSVLRSNGIPLAVVGAAFLLFRRVGWRALTAGAVAFAVPLLGYVLVFHSEHGQYNITSSDGIFLWSGTTSFANCAIIKPPPQLLPLCPNREKSVSSAPAPAWSVQALLNAPAPAAYLWASDVWWRHDAHPGINSYNDKLGMQFAIDAIKAQPLDYLRVSARDVLLIFLSTDRPLTRTSMSFTTTGRYVTLPSYYARDMKAYAGTTSNTHPVEPYAYFMFLYQEPVYFPGIVFFAVLVAGLVGIIARRRQWRGPAVPPAVLPWVLAAVSIVIPALLKESLYRYAMVAIPLACLAAGLAFARQRPQRSLATSDGNMAPATAQPAGPARPDTVPSDAARPDAVRPEDTGPGAAAAPGIATGPPPAAMTPADHGPDAGAGPSIPPPAEPEADAGAGPSIPPPAESEADAGLM